MQHVFIVKVINVAFILALHFSNIFPQLHCLNNYSFSEICWSHIELKMKHHSRRAQENQNTVIKKILKNVFLV